MSCCDGFRLPAASECSLRSKARIDALFEDSRSICSSNFTGWCPSHVGPTAIDNDGCCNDDDQRRVNSAVQARIEAMFASVEAESTSPGECAAAVLPVKYMGAAPVGGRVASVRGLQEPLRQLVERIGDSVSAELEVSRRGLTFRTSELHEKNNPFRRIAVWSALKLQRRQRHGSTNSQDLLHAFVPLVADDRSIGPANSTATTTNIEDRHADLYRTMRGLTKDVENYPPIFAVVMRRPGAARLLECHAFACRCEEDAIAAAATLYRALLADLDATSRRPRQKNGLGCVSLASVISSVRETSPGSKRRLDFGNKTDVIIESIPPPASSPPSIKRPVRPPRVKKSSMSSSVNTEDELSSSTPCTNASTADKLQVGHKKKDSDVKAEDVLEARSRRLYSPSKVNESNAMGRRAENSSSSTCSNVEQTNEERRMNAKNKIYGTRNSQCRVSPDEVQVIEKIYDERKPSHIETVEVYRENTDKSASDRERSGSYEFDCCTENSLYESNRIYTKAQINCSRSKSEQRIYELSRPSDRSTTPSHRSTTSSGRQNNYVTRPAAPPPNRPNHEPIYNENRRRSIASSNYGSNTAARRREHFRNADKIYSLGSEEIYARNVGGPIIRNEDRIYDVMRSSRPTMRSDVSEYSTHSNKTRLSRVSTMDRPLRKSNTNNQQTHNQKPPQQKLPQPPPPAKESVRPRRRSRAGSEPPTSRTEAAASSTALIKRSQSDLDIDRGDLLTRVELPRRGSFLKPGSVRKRDGIEGGGGGTPLGFTELFDEFRNQEGLTSVDDILAAIIDPEGMSFNDLKPLYKEFLLKLAATLTQDELYQRSASIMKRRRRPQRRRSSRNLLRRAIKRSVSRLRSASSAPTEFTSVIFPARRLNDRSSYGSSSSCDNKNHHRVLASKLGRRRSTNRCNSAKSRVGHTTSEDSDTCRRIGRNVLAANRSSSGYVSCSECSYDSESCTCVSADKCYCSLSRKTTQQDVETQVTHCSCDTDSCSESNKCYCAKKPITGQLQPSILEQLRQKGIVPSESTLSRGASPDRSKNNRVTKSLASSKSLEYLKVHSPSVRGSTDNLALDYDLFSPGNDGRRSSACSSSSEKVLVVSARDPQGRLIYVGGTERGNRNGKRSSKHCQSGRHRHGNNNNNGHHEALSIKKSAEIAAVFGGPPRIGRRASSTSSLRSSVSLEAGLGYLP